MEEGVSSGQSAMCTKFCCYNATEGILVQNPYMEVKKKKKGGVDKRKTTTEPVFKTVKSNGGRMDGKYTQRGSRSQGSFSRFFTTAREPEHSCALTGSSDAEASWQAANAS